MTGQMILGFFVVWAGAMAGLVLYSHRWWFNAPRIQLRCSSTTRNPGRFWNDRVFYDAWGAPYARAHDGSEMRLFEGGKTGDTQLYGTEWRHTGGPAVTFPKASNLHYASFRTDTRAA